MEKEELGRFSATSFDEKVINFVVYNDNTIDCPTLNAESFRMIELKPRFCLWNKKGCYTYNVRASHGDKSQLIQNYDIDEDLFAYLKENRMIKYSTDMAYLYGFKDKSGYDSGYDISPRNHGVGSPYKWASKKRPILVKQRKGQYN
jgi:hypothetical protein